MGIATLVIGIVLLAIGIGGQGFLQRKPAAHKEDRKGFNLVVTIGSIVVGAWLLIISTVHLLHAYHPAMHS